MEELDLISSMQGWPIGAAPRVAARPSEPPTARFAPSSRAQAKGGLAETHSPHQEPHFPRCVGSNQHARKDPQLREIPLHMGMRCNLGEPGRTVEPGRKVSAMPLMPQFIPALPSDAHELMLSRFCGHLG